MQVDRIGLAQSNPIVRRLECLNDLRFGVNATNPFNEVPSGRRRIASFCQEDSRWRKSLRRTQRVVLVLDRETTDWKQVTKNGIILKGAREKTDVDRIIAAFPKTSTFLFVPLWQKKRRANRGG